MVAHEGTCSILYICIHVLYIPSRLLTMQYIEDITRWREDMNFMFEWQEQYLTSERVSSCHETYGKYATRVPDEVAYGIYE